MRPFAGRHHRACYMGENHADYSAATSADGALGIASVACNPLPSFLFF